ncbi:MAG: MerR family transcriptional regulator [Thermodesulfobacteriota bacterium]
MNVITQIPDKRYFKIGEVCKIVDVKQHVVRYWETEFKQFVKPQRASSKQRLYRRVDIESLLRIKQLLKEDGFTIPGARKFLANQEQPLEQSQVSPAPQQSPTVVKELKDDIRAILNLLEEKN